MAQALNTAGENLQHIWGTLWLTIKLLGLQIWESITTGWNNFWKGIDLALRMAGAALQAAWSACWLIIKLAAMQIWEGVTTAWSNFWKGLSLLLSMAGAALNAVWTAAWSALADTVSSIWDGITSVVRGAVNDIIRIINGMISAIVGGMNAVIGLLNGFSFDVPEFAQDALGTAKVGFNIDPITAPQIPYLAQGAVIPANHEFLAVLGDQTNGTNIEAPLATIQQALAEVMEAQDVSDSLPADYTAMSSDVGTLKNQMQRAYPDNSTIGENPWSSKNIVDMLCPPIEESGNPVVCYPVAGYQLGVKAKWEPMQEGTGTPSPENIRPIKGLGSVTVTRCGENLLNFPQITTWTQITKTYKFKFKAGTYYLYCGNVVHGGSSAPAIAFSDATSKVASISLEQGMKKEIQLKKDCQFVILYTNGYDYYGSAGVTATVEDLMLVASNEIPSVYTPYIGQTNTLTLPETVYGGEVDAVTGEGQETWQILNNPSSYDYYEGAPEGGWSQSEDAVAWYLDNPTLFPYKTKVLSNIFNSVSDVVHTTKPYLIGSASHFIAFRLPRSVAATGNDVKNWLASNDVEIAFEPIDKTPFTATGAQPIPALAGVNTVLTDADSATVTGRADPIKRITDLEDAVASQT